ncbi:MAG: LytTR family DNA-binding domain-containing protein [Bacteroidota bacterium]
MIQCLIVDDEPVARGIIRNYCGHLPFLQIVAECGNAFETKEILLTGRIDLLFLDINMPVLSGTSFLATLKNPPVVIFTTAYQEYALQAFDLAACDYLLKPFSLERFIVAVDKAREKIQPAAKKIEEIQDSFFIKTDGRLVKIAYQDCLYAEAQGNYTKVVTINAPMMTKVPLTELLGQLPPTIFVRVHRSFIINKNKIESIEGNRVFIQQQEVPVSGVYKEALLKLISVI